jgi:HEAT repeat protein
MGRTGDVNGLMRELANDLESEALPVRAVAMRYLGKLGDPKSATAIEGLLLGDKRHDVRVIAARALGEIGEQGSVQALVQALATPSPALQAEAARSLGKIGDHRAVPALVSLVESADKNPRDMAIEALERIGGNEAEAAMREAMVGSPFLLRRRLRRALRKARM